MKKPRITNEGIIPGTTWYADNYTDEYSNVKTKADFLALAEELETVSRWTLASAKWARWKAQTMKPLPPTHESGSFHG